MNMPYVVTALIWSLIGLVVGYALAKAEISISTFYRRNSVTTPQRLRRRQYMEGVGMVVLGISLVISTTISERRDDEQDRIAADNTAQSRACIIKQVKGIGTYLDARAGTTQANTESVNNVINGAAMAFATNDTTALAKALKDYTEAQKIIAENRKKVVLPDFPSGECEPVINK